MQSRKTSRPHIHHTSYIQRSLALETWPAVPKMLDPEALRLYVVYSSMYGVCRAPLRGAFHLDLRLRVMY